MDTILPSRLLDKSIGANFHFTSIWIGCLEFEFARCRRRKGWTDRWTDTQTVVLSFRRWISLVFEGVVVEAFTMFSFWADNHSSWYSDTVGIQITMPKKKIAQLFEDSWFVHRRWNYKKSVSILKSFKKSINWVVSERCSSKTLKTTMIWSKYVNSAYCQKERFHISLWTVPFTFI